MNAEFQWWLLILGIVVGGALVYLVLADIRSDDEGPDWLGDGPPPDHPDAEAAGSPGSPAVDLLDPVDDVADPADAADPADSWTRPDPGPGPTGG